VRLAQPVRERYFGLVTGRGEGRERSFEIALSDEHVEVLGVTFDARISGEGIGSADQHVEVGLLEHAQRRAVERFRFRFENLQRRLDNGHVVPNDVARVMPAARRASCCQSAASWQT